MASLSSAFLCDDAWWLIESFIPAENNLQATCKHFKLILPVRLAYYKLVPICDSGLTKQPPNNDITRLICTGTFIPDSNGKKRLHNSPENLSSCDGTTIFNIYPNLVYISIPKISQSDVRTLICGMDESSTCRTTKIRAIHSSTYEIEQTDSDTENYPDTFEPIKLLVDRLGYGVRPFLMSTWLDADSEDDDDAGTQIYIPVIIKNIDLRARRELKDIVVRNQPLTANTFRSKCYNSKFIRLHICRLYSLTYQKLAFVVSYATRTNIVFNGNLVTVVF